MSFPAARIQVSPSSWEAERHRRGQIRWYPTTALLQVGLASAGSTATLGIPSASLFTGVLTVTPSSKGREMGEKPGAPGGSNIFNGIDGLDYWQRRQYASVFMGLPANTLNALNAQIFAGLMLRAPGFVPMILTPGDNYAMLLYAQRVDGVGVRTETWELWSADGTGAAALITTLTGVTGPKSGISAGGQRTQRLELIYNPGVELVGMIDGVVGARHTTSLPDPTRVPLAAAVLAGVGVYVSNGQINDFARADFHSLLLETYR